MVEDSPRMHLEETAMLKIINPQKLWSDDVQDAWLSQCWRS